MLDIKDIGELKNLVTIEPIRKLESNEEIKDVFTIRDGNRVHIGFVVDQWESASYPISIWVGAKIVKNEQTSSS